MSEHYDNFPYYMPPVFSVFLMGVIYSISLRTQLPAQVDRQRSQTTPAKKHVIEKESNCVEGHTRGHHVPK